MKLSEYLRKKVSTKFNRLVKKDKCQSCGSTENLHVHHVYPFKDMINDTLDELGYELKEVNEYSKLELLNIKEKILGKHLSYAYKTLCRDCHIKEHNKKRKNKTEEKFDINKFYIGDNIINKWMLEDEIVNSIISNFNIEKKYHKKITINTLTGILYLTDYKIESKVNLNNGIDETYYKISNITDEDNKLYGSENY